jgi:hypothetical protein
MNPTMFVILYVIVVAAILNTAFLPKLRNATRTEKKRLWMGTLAGFGAIGFFLAIAVVR